MNQDQITCLEAYLKLFKGTAFDTPSFTKQTLAQALASLGLLNQEIKLLNKKN